jgi:hypothetical protein
MAEREGGVFLVRWEFSYQLQIFYRLCCSKTTPSTHKIFGLWFLHQSFEHGFDFAEIIVFEIGFFVSDVNDTAVQW